MSAVRRPPQPPTFAARLSQGRHDAQPPVPTRTIGKAQVLGLPPGAQKLVQQALTDSSRHNDRALGRPSVTRANQLVSPQAAPRTHAAGHSTSYRAPSAHTAPALGEAAFELELDSRIFDKASRADRREVSRSKDAQRAARRDDFRDFDDDWDDGESSARRRR